MGASIIIFPFILFCFLCSPHFIASAKNCRNNQCGKGEPVISYPFRTKGRQDKQCGFPGFDLTCDNMDRTVVELPFSGRFFVKTIYYGSTYNEIQLEDPDNCLTRRYLNQVNLSGTPFIGINFTDYSFYNCSSDFSYYFYIDLTIISCLSIPNHTVIATSPSSDSPILFDRNCVHIATRRVPVDRSSSFNFPYGFPLSYESTVLHLTWEWAESPTRTGSSTGDQIDFKKFLISIGIIFPILFAAVMYCISCCGANSHSQNVSSGAVQRTTPQSVDITTTGLGGSAIKSFPIVVLGESGRLPDPNINTCAICLSEYQPKETLKNLPLCNHYFHADCINVWLHLKSTCPVCRKYPLP